MFAILHLPFHTLCYDPTMDSTAFPLLAVEEKGLLTTEDALRLLTAPASFWEGTAPLTRDIRSADEDADVDEEESDDDDDLDDEFDDDIDEDDLDDLDEIEEGEDDDEFDDEDDLDDDEEPSDAGGGDDF